MTGSDCCAQAGIGRTAAPVSDLRNMRRFLFIATSDSTLVYYLGSSIDISRVEGIFSDANSALS
jgi:hypothetical protein